MQKSLTFLLLTFLWESHWHLGGSSSNSPEEKSLLNSNIPSYLYNCFFPPDFLRGSYLLEFSHWIFLVLPTSSELSWMTILLSFFFILLIGRNRNTLVDLSNETLWNIDASLTTSSLLPLHDQSIKGVPVWHSSSQDKSVLQSLSLV